MRSEITVAQPFRAARAAVGRPERLHYQRPLVILKRALANEAAPMPKPIAWPRTLRVVVSFAALVAAGGALTTSRGDAVRAQEDNPAFEVATVKPNKSGETRESVRFFPPSGRVVVVNTSLRSLIRSAYQLQDFQIVGGPPWLDAERFDITANAEGNPPPRQKWLMMRSLLKDRFKLAVHTETREMPVFALVIANRSGTLGPQLHKVEVNCQPPTSPPSTPPDPNRPNQCGGMFAGPTSIKFRGVTIEDFARMGLSPRVHRTVIDRTGLEGRFDFDLDFAPEPLTAAIVDDPNATVAGDKPSIFTAVQEQLGLKLDAQRGPVDVLVIDHAEQAKEN
jgi:uncharacterized protein (TIGR03435 family)